MTRSPSRVITMRTVPCVAGCDGPMLITIGSVGMSCSNISGRWAAKALILSEAWERFISRSVVAGPPELWLCVVMLLCTPDLRERPALVALLRRWHRLDWRPLVEGIVLAQRVS